VTVSVRVMPEDRNFRRVDDRGEGGAADPAEIGDRHRRAAHLIGPILRACARAARSADFAGDLPQALAVGIADDRDHQPVRRVHGNADMNVLLEDQRFAIGESDALKRGNCKALRASAFTWKASAVSLTARACASAFRLSGGLDGASHRRGRDGSPRDQRLCRGQVAGRDTGEADHRLLGDRAVCE
jgi:hypothetical protein